LEDWIWDGCIYWIDALAPSSVEGYYVEAPSSTVIMLDEVTESFLIKEDSKLVTKNHTDLELDEFGHIRYSEGYDNAEYED